MKCTRKQCSNEYLLTGTQNALYTFENIVANDWQVVEESEDKE